MASPRAVIQSAATLLASIPFLLEHPAPSHAARTRLVLIMHGDPPPPTPAPAARLLPSFFGRKKQRHWDSKSPVRSLNTLHHKTPQPSRRDWCVNVSVARLLMWGLPGLKYDNVIFISCLRPPPPCSVKSNDDSRVTCGVLELIHSAG